MKIPTPRLLISDSKQIKSVDTFSLSSPPATNLLPRTRYRFSYVGDILRPRPWLFHRWSRHRRLLPLFVRVCMGGLAPWDLCKKSRSRPRTRRGPIDRKGTYYTYGGISAIQHDTPPRPTPVTLSSCYPHCEITRRRHLSANATYNENANSNSKIIVFFFCCNSLEEDDVMVSYRFSTGRRCLTVTPDVRVVRGIGPSARFTARARVVFQRLRCGEIREKSRKTYKPWGGGGRTCTVFFFLRVTYLEGK